jgi:hypothetical protein
MFDIDHFEMSAKDNVARRAKLFLSCIKRGKIINGEFVSDVNKYTHLEEYFPYDEAWANATQELSNCETYPDLLNRVERLAQQNIPFFVSLRTALQRIEDDITLQKQLKAALTKQSPSIMFTTLDAPRTKTPKQGENSSEEVSDDSESGDRVVSQSKPVLNQNRNITIHDDNTLRATRSLLRAWSKQLFASEMFKYDE